MAITYTLTVPSGSKISIQWMPDKQVNNLFDYMHKYSHNHQILLPHEVDLYVLRIYLLLLTELNYAERSAFSKYLEIVLNDRTFDLYNFTKTLDYLGITDKILITLMKKIQQEVAVNFYNNRAEVSVKKNNRLIYSVPLFSDSKGKPPFVFQIHDKATEYEFPNENVRVDRKVAIIYEPFVKSANLLKNFSTCAVILDHYSQKGGGEYLADFGYNLFLISTNEMYISQPLSEIRVYEDHEVMCSVYKNAHILYFKLDEKYLAIIVQNPRLYYPKKDSEIKFKGSTISIGTALNSIRFPNRNISFFSRSRGLTVERTSSSNYPIKLIITGVVSEPEYIVASYTPNTLSFPYSPPRSSRSSRSSRSRSADA